MKIRTEYIDSSGADDIEIIELDDDEEDKKKKKIELLETRCCNALICMICASKYEANNLRGRVE
jgi:hypothetical protein